MNCENHLGANCPNCRTADKVFTNEELTAIVRRLDNQLRVAREDLILLEEGFTEELKGVRRIKIKLEPGAKAPVRSTAGAAAWDVFAYIAEPLTINPGERGTFPTGIAAALPPGFYWDKRARSGISTNYGMILVNGAAVIDEDFRGISKITYFNSGAEPYTIQPGEKIAQAILSRYYAQEFDVVDELDQTARGAGGLGHTGRE